MKTIKKKIMIILNVSSSEGVPVSIMEAMSFGIIPIATNVGGVSELIVDKESGFLIKKDFETLELINLILLIKNLNTTEYNNFREKVRKRWEDISNADKCFKQFVIDIL